jgi:hypothetical protein
MESCSDPRVHPVPVARHLYVLTQYSAIFAFHCASASEPRDDDDIATFDDGSWTGNKRRKLWKSACVHGALNVGNPHYSPGAFADVTRKVKSLGSGAGVVCLPGSLFPDHCSFEISMPHMGGLPMGSSEHHV